MWNGRMSFGSVEFVSKGKWLEMQGMNFWQRSGIELDSGDIIAQVVPADWFQGLFYFTALV